MQNSTNFIYFGSSNFSVHVLDELSKRGIKPRLVVTTPDKPQGRKLILQPNVVKSWAIENGVQYFDVAKLNADFVKILTDKTKELNVSLFIVASYGKIIPRGILEIPEKGTLNIHPSLLPLYRGPSPLPTSILDDSKDTGVSIMKLDEEMDHGPIVAQKNVHIAEWPTYEVFEEMMARLGANLLADTMPNWVAGDIQAKDQDHTKATFTKKMVKEEALIDADVLNLASLPSNDQYAIFRKIQAYHEWPQAFFFINRKGSNIRVKITDSSFDNGKLTLLKVIPEGGKEMTFEDFRRGL